MYMIDRDSIGKTEYLSHWGYSEIHGSVIIKLDYYEPSPFTKEGVLKDKEVNGAYSHKSTQKTNKYSDLENIDIIDLTYFRNFTDDKLFSSIEVNSLVTVNVHKDFMKELISIKSEEEFQEYFTENKERLKEISADVIKDILYHSKSVENAVKGLI